MITRRANATDLETLRRLLANGRWVYRSLGDEDLRALVDRQLCVVGEERGRLWGLVGVEREVRPTTLPPTAPDRAYLRAVALGFGHAPGSDGVRLVSAAVANLQAGSVPTLLIVFTGEPWLVEILPAAGFSLAEQVQTFQLDPRHSQVARLVPPATPVTLRPMHPADLEQVAQLDARAFDPLWHYGERALWELLFAGRTQVALLDDQLVGYTGVAQRDRVLHLTRIAVEPDAQGQGIGAVLLADVIDYGRSQHAHTLTLNTQVSNERAQQLYGRYGFQPTPQVARVFTYQTSA
jgi:[ribosomal protein S18]-alanine N-acetyltransferase